MQFGAYQLGELIHASTSSRVHRARRIADGLEVFVKTPAPLTKGIDAGARLRHELLVCTMFDAPGLIRAVELIEDGPEGEVALVLESVADGATLRERVVERGGRLPPREAVKVALGILDALATLHARNIVHKDIKPDNVLVDREFERVVVLDFGIAAIVPRDAGAGVAIANAKLEGTLAFIPPEQTGRINRPIDYRSDYYALGATLHWMLVGEPPFGELGEPEQLVHAHIARVPRPINERDPTIPPALARIVAKLLSKAADERYQGAFGLRADLHRCLAALVAGERGEFAIAEVDPAEHLRLPHHAYGRATQLASLHAMLAAVDQQAQIVVLRGPLGSGKTTLARELLASIDGDTLVAEARSPADIAASLQALLAEQLDGSPARAARGEVRHAASLGRFAGLLASRLRERLGPNAALLFDRMPELRSLLGPQSSVAAVGPGEARDRFHDTLDRFVDALLLPDRRYVVFVDDLARTEELDEFGARVLEILCAGRDRRLLLLLALRDDPRPSSAGLPNASTRTDAHEVIARARARGVAVSELELGPLTHEDVVRLVGDALDGAPGCRELAELLHQRTHGTPLFVAQLLGDLYVEGIVEVDRATGRWRVDLDRASQRESSGDVVEYLVGRFAALSEQTRRALALAACIGPSFELTTLAELAHATDRTLSEGLSATLWEASAAGYLLTDSEGWSSGGGRSSTPASLAISYRFAHERLRQIALSAAPAKRGPLHVVIAGALCEAALNSEQLARVAEHVGEALSHHAVIAEQDRARFAIICETAGVLAKDSAAYAAAARHFDAAQQLTSDAPAPDQLAVALELGECLYMCGRTEAAHQVFARARELVGSRAELINLLTVCGALVMVRSENERALAIAMEAAGLFGLDLRRHDSPAWGIELIAEFMAEFATLTPAQLAALPVLDDPEQVGLIKLLAMAIYPAYLTGDIGLFCALLVTVIRYGFTRGLTEHLAVCVMQFALVMIYQQRDLEGARRWTQLGLAVLERFPGSAVEGEVEFVYHGTLQFWLEPFAECFTPLARAHHKLRASGSLVVAGHAVGARTLYELLVGVPLEQVIDDADEAVAYLREIGDATVEKYTQTYGLVARALQGGPSPEPPVLAAGGPATDVLIYTMHGYAYLLLGDRTRAAAALAGAQPYAPLLVGHVVELWYGIIRVLFDCEDYPSMSAEQAAAHARRVAAMLEWLDVWERSCPTNATPFRALIAGAWARAQGQLAEACEALTTAADAAAAAHAHNLEGFACELAGAIWLERGDRRRAIGYLADALHAYARWGAVPLQRRVRDLLREHGHFSASLTGTGSTSSSLNRGSESSKALDVASVIKMSQAILEATELEEVIDRLLAAVNENAGADRCVLLLDGNDGLHLRAERRAGAELSLRDEGLRLDDARQLVALAIVRACERNLEPVIVDDALRDARCVRDPYIRSRRPRALLVVPILTRSRRVGLLYLENHVTPGAFTPHHLQLATTLAAQAAGSIENARLFEALRGSEAQWRAVVFGAPDHITIIDRRLRIEFINRLSPALGFTYEQVLGRSIGELVGDEVERARLITAVEFVFTTGSTTRVEFAVEMGGTSRLFLARIGPIVRAGVVERVTIIASDITDQRRLEDDLRHSQKMQAIGTLAGGVAHDFNNLLTVILGACDLSLLHAADNRSLLGLLGEIEAAATRAATLTRQLLAFGRKQMLQPKRFDLAELVAELGKMLERLLGEHITLALELDGPALVYADPGQLSQVLINLTVNARDAMPGGGIVRVSVGRNELDEVEVEVADTGVGMDAELVSHIFEPFFTTKGEGKGTGLGLSTVIGIVEQSGGRITVDSEPGQGSRFRVVLPSADEVEQRSSTAPAPALPRGTEAILLVEDELAVQRLASRMLELQGYRVTVAASGEQALALAREIPELDLLITDVVMPGIGGPEVAQRVLELHPHAKVLFISGHTSDEVLHRGVQDGTQTLLQKPFTREALARQVRALLDPSPRS